jgi:hypothetical protein
MKVVSDPEPLEAGVKNRLMGFSKEILMRRVKM